MLLALLALLATAPEAPPAAAAPSAPAAAKAPRAPKAPPAPASLPAPPGVATRLAGEWPAASGKRVTLEGKSSIDGALSKIAAAAGWNLVANTGRTGDRLLVLTLKDAPVESALEAVLEGTILQAMRRGDTVTVAPSLSPPAPPVEVPVLSGFEKPSGKKFTGSFDNEDLPDALQKVFEASGLSLVLPPGLRGTVTARFHDAPLEDVLRVLLVQGNLVALREGNIVTVSRAAGGQTIIRGNKRISIHVPRVDVELDNVAEEAREAAEEARQAGQEAKASHRGHRRGRADKVISGNFVAKPGERVEEIVVFRGNARLEAGATADQITVIGGSVELAPGVQVEREVVAILGDIHVSPGARIGGDAVSVGGQITIDDGGEVDGQQVSVSIPGAAGLASMVGMAVRPNPVLSLLSALVQFAVCFLLGLLFLQLAPRRVAGVAAALVQAPVKTVLVGFVGHIATFFLIVLLAVTVIGIPLSLVVAVGFVVALVLGFTALALLVGRQLGPRLDRGGDVLRLAAGTAIVVLLSRVPFLGGMAMVVATLYVFGSVVRTRFGQPGAPAAPLETTVAPPAPPAAPA